MERQPLNLPSNQPPARTYAFLSVGAALITIVLKSSAYLLTSSVGLLSDALESGVNLVAALVAVWALTLAARPADVDHLYGHSKAEYIASAVEGILILVAAFSIGWAAIERLFHLRTLEHVWQGLAISTVAAGVNGGVALIVLRAGNRLRSITLRADAHHLLTDVWTSLGVVVAVVLVALTGWLILDPLIALAVAANIVWTAISLLRDTANGVLDHALPDADQACITNLLAPYAEQGITFHAVRTRVAGQRRFISLHILVPGDWTIHRGHDLAEQIEQQIRAALPKSTVFTHLEPKEDAASYDDQGLERLDTVEQHGLVAR
jgi:cation diffusion facilitator family transporter